jgi:trigger factor
LIKTKAKPNKKEITKDEAEKILKEHQNQEHNHDHDIKDSGEKEAVTKNDPVKPKNKESIEAKAKKVSKK